MKAPKRPPKSNRAIEDKLTDRILLTQTCADEVKEWLELVNSPGFATNIKLQNKASLIARGIVLKIRIIKSELCDDKMLLDVADSIAKEYGQVWDRKAVELLVNSGESGEGISNITVAFVQAKIEADLAGNKG